MRPLLVTAACAVALLASVPAARADTLTVNFETGPALGTPVTDDYLASAFVRFLEPDPRFRPYRRSAPGLARSGSVAADVGSDVCVPEAGPGIGCELPTGGTYGRLTRTASSVRLFAGLFSAPAAPVTARLIGYRANGSVAATGTAVPIGTSGFTTAVTVTSAAADIASFELIPEGDGAPGATIGFDDLTFTYPKNSLPDVSLTAPTDVVPLLQGKTATVPLQLTRLNGSSGGEHMSVAGLPPGVTAQVVPATVPGTQGTATLRLTAAANAAPFEQPRDVTVTADPQGDANVAPAARTVKVPVRLASNFDLTGPDGAAVPTCAATNVGLRLRRDRAFTGTVTLAAQNLPPGVTAEFLPGTSIPPGGGFDVDVTLRLHGGASFPPDTPVVVRASSPVAPARTVTLIVTAAPPVATIEAPAVGLTPRHMTAGTGITLSGNGFCPGTQVRVGAFAAMSTTTQSDDGRELAFRVPRLALSGPVTVVPPAPLPSYETTNALLVRGFRDTYGFPFVNYAFGSLSIDELTDLVGADDLFIKINPCWPWGDCTVVTGVLDPIAAIDWGALDAALHYGGGGHCLGMVRAPQEIAAHQVPLTRFASVDSVFGLPGPSGPQGDQLKSYLDARQAMQGTAEYIHNSVARVRDLDAQLDKIQAEMQAGRDPGIVLLNGGSGHAVLAYDVEDLGDGAKDIHVYDPNRPFTSVEANGGAEHETRENASVIHVNAAHDHWDYQGVTRSWSGGRDDGALFAVPYDWVPTDPSLPGLSDLEDVITMILVGSADDAVRIDGGADFLPVLDEGLPPRSNGWVVGPAGGGPVSSTVRGVKTGTYTQAVTGRAFAASATIATSPGVRDRTTGSPDRRRIAFSALGHARPRTLKLELAAQLGRDAARAAIVRTSTAGGGGETAALGSGRTLALVHRGAPAALSFRLSATRRDGGTAAFASGQLRIGRGERMTATPADWTALGRVRLTIRHRDGRTTHRTLRNHIRPAARLSLATPRLHGRRVSVRARFGAVPRRAAAGVVLRLVRRGRTTARRVIALRRPHAGARRFAWRLPASVRGRYRLVATATLSVQSGTVRRSRAATVRVR